MDMFIEGVKFAAQAHGSQVRRYTDGPYVVHPLSVAEIVAGVLPDPEVVLAAVLHDVLEDTSVTVEDICKAFGARVAALVVEVTDVSQPADGNRAVRKTRDMKHLSNASPEGQTIKLADLIHNSLSIVEHDPGFAKIYIAEKQALLAVLTKGDKTLHGQAVKIVESYYGGS